MKVEIKITKTTNEEVDLLVKAIKDLLLDFSFIVEQKQKLNKIKIVGVKVQAEI